MAKKKMIRIIGNLDFDVMDRLMWINDNNWNISKGVSMDYYKPPLDFMREELSKLIDDLRNAKNIRLK